MKGRTILAAIFLLPAIVSGYMTRLMWQAGDSGKWLFGVFTLFFVLLTLTPILPKLRPPQPKPITSTRFVPHWFMMLAVLVVLGTIILAIVNAILSH